MRTFALALMLMCALTSPVLGQLGQQAKRPDRYTTIKQLVDQYGSYPLYTALDALMGDYLKQRSAPMKTKKARICFVIDDQPKEWATGTVGSPPESIRQLLKQNNIRVGFSLSPGSTILGRADTTTATGILSVWNVKSLVRDGHEIGSGGRTEPGSWFHGDIGKLATGVYTLAQLDAQMIDHFTGDVRCLQDTIGPLIGIEFPHPRWHSSSNSSECYVTSRYADAAGFDYVVVFPNTMSVASPQGQRPNELYPLNCARWGEWGTGGAGGSRLAAIPGVHNSPYEILGCVAESSDTAATFKVFRHAEHTGGLVVINFHRASTWESNLQGAAGFKAVLQHIKAKVDAGRMEVLTPSEAFDLYYSSPISPELNFMSPNLQDLDGDTHWDGWFSSSGSLAAADTALLNLLPVAVGHGGRRAYALNWNDDGPNTNSFAGGISADSTWEHSNATRGIIPPAGGGWTAKFECWVAADTTVATSLPVAAAGRADAQEAVGVMFGSPMESFQNRYNVAGAPSLKWTYDNNARYAPMTSHGDMFSVNSDPWPGGAIRLVARNNARRSTTKEWAHLVAEYDVPEYADYLYVSLWKSIVYPAGYIVVSDFSLTFFQRGSVPPAAGVKALR